MQLSNTAAAILLAPAGEALYYTVAKAYLGLRTEAKFAHGLRILRIETFPAEIPGLGPSNPRISSLVKRSEIPIRDYNP